MRKNALDHRHEARELDDDLVARHGRDALVETFDGRLELLGEEADLATAKIHEHDGLPARGLGVFIGDRLALFYDYSADLGNGWEDEDRYGDPPASREAALGMGVNLFAYALSQVAR